MAHLLVSSETVVVDHPQKENIGAKSKGKHKRDNQDDGGLTCSEGSVWQGSGSTKRQALASITNHPDRVFANLKVASQKRLISSPLTSSSGLPSQFGLDASSSAFTSEGGEMKPIGSEMSFSKSQNDSKMSYSMAVSSSMAMSSSFRSLESPMSFDSPMNVSSPDCFASHLHCNELVDIDLLEDSNSTKAYASDIFAYLKEAEVRFHPNPHYMKKQPDITEGMRSILVDWLVEVAEEFRLDQQTLYMSLSIVDRFLSSMSVMRSKLQLVGGTAIYIASKFEEIFPPEIADFAYITDDTYTKSQIVRMEQLVLKVLDFNLAGPTTHTFLLRYLKASEAEHLRPSLQTKASLVKPTASQLSETITYLAMYLCELALQDYDPYLKYYPSVIAASAVCLARHTMGQTAWPGILQHYSNYNVCDIGNCVQDLHRTLALAPHHAQQAIRHKYSSPAYHMISSIKAPETLPC